MWSRQVIDLKYMTYLTLKNLGVHGGVEIADNSEIHAYSHIPLLQDGLVLVDTPGFDAGIGQGDR